jgi:hypothetical protein
MATPISYRQLQDMMDERGVEVIIPGSSLVGQVRNVGTRPVYNTRK